LPLPSGEMNRTIVAQVGYSFGWPGFWILLILAISVLVVAFYLFMRSQPPPGGPRIGE
jgi:hypothetical protein